MNRTAQASEPAFTRKVRGAVADVLFAMPLLVVAMVLVQKLYVEAIEEKP